MSGKDSNNYEGIKKMLENPVYAGKFVMKDMLPVKQSTVILDFAKPLLNKIDIYTIADFRKTIK